MLQFQYLILLVFSHPNASIALLPWYPFFPFLSVTILGKITNGNHEAMNNHHEIIISNNGAILLSLINSFWFWPNLIILHRYNHSHNILGLFDVFQIFLSPQMKRCTIISYKYGICELLHDLPKGLRLRILGN